MLSDQNTSHIICTRASDQVASNNQGGDGSEANGFEPSEKRINTGGSNYTPNFNANNYNNNNNSKLLKYFK